MNDQKRCSKCEKTKPLVDFYKDKNVLDGHCRWCKQCRSVYDKEGTQKQDRRDKRKNSELIRYYNITLEDYERMLVEQDLVCAICKSNEPGGTRSYFAVDHDHSCCPGRNSCGKCVRGLLCHGCNTCVVTVIELGLIEAASEYIDKYNI